MQRDARRVNLGGRETWGTEILSAELRGETEDEADDGYVSVLQPATCQAVPWLRVPLRGEKCTKNKGQIKHALILSH